MGKKMKKSPNPRKAQQRASAGSPKSFLEGSSPKIGSGSDGHRVKDACSHYNKSTNELNRNLLKIQSTSMYVVACEYCREEPASRKGGKEKSKQPKKKGVGKRAAEEKSDQHFMWVCLDCGRYFCGGGVSMLEPYGHARRHAKQEHHQWSVRADDPLIIWCYSCSSSVHIETLEEELKGENEAAMNDKSWSLRGIALEPLDSEKLKGNKVRGLSNLGNTCFFNSIMQNLFAMDLLRDTLLGLDRPTGPLSMALRAVFAETSRGSDSKGVINPKALFGCISAKSPQFRGYQQHDSHELLRYLLDGLHMEETNARKTSELVDDQGENNVKSIVTLVDTIFSGQLLSTVSCMECHHTSVVYEPFLDLSLPVPSKKHSSKKVPPPPKRANQRDKNKSRRFRERGVPQVSTMSANQKAESSEQPSECSESGVVVLVPTHDTASEAHDFTWMDYLGAELQNCNDFAAHELEAPIMQGSYGKQENVTESDAQSVSELHDETKSNAQSASELNTGSSKDFTVYPNTFAERSCTDEFPHSCVPVPGVILLPYEDQEQDLTDLDINDRTLFSHDPESTNPIDVSVSESCATNSRCEQAEDFDGIGDLFNEPEATSDLNAKTNAGEEMDITLWSGNFSESNLEEVDDTNSPVSINSCLALFTKPELLSDEQAWYCERCSEILSQENSELGTSKLQANKVSDQFVTAMSVVEEDEFTSKKVASDSHGNSANVEVLDNGKVVSSPKNVTVLEEGHFYQQAEMCASQKQISQAEGSQNSGEISGNETLHLEETPHCSNMACSPDVFDNDMSESETSQLFLTPVCVNRQAQDGSSNEESNFHGKNNRSAGNNGKKTEVFSQSSKYHTNEALHKSCEDRSQEVYRVRKKGLKSGKVHPTKDNKGEGITMVKRDATKRILIDRVPPIITIHLKRFSQDARGRLTKLNGHVSFQETLDLRPYMDPKCIKDQACYSLIGVVEHSGSMGGGHYVAYVRGDRCGKKATTSGGGGGGGGGGGAGKAWFYTSDAYVKEVSMAEVLQSEAYILFYEKV